MNLLEWSCEWEEEKRRAERYHNWRRNKIVKEAKNRHSEGWEANNLKSLRSAKNTPKKRRKIIGKN